MRHWRIISHNGQCHWQCHNDYIKGWQVWHGQLLEKSGFCKLSIIHFWTLDDESRIFDFSH